MAYSVEFDSEHQIVRVLITGRLDVENGLAATAEGIELAEQHQARRFLFDVRGAEVDAELVDVYEMPDRIWDLGAKPDNRAAIIYSQDLLTYEFLENVARNRGQNVNTFKDEEKAIKWLTAES